MGLAASTVSERVKRAEKKIIKSTLKRLRDCPRVASICPLYFHDIELTVIQDFTQ